MALAIKGISRYSLRKEVFMIAVFRVFILCFLVFVFMSCGEVRSGRESDPRYKETRREGDLDWEIEDGDEVITDTPSTVADKLEKYLVNLYSSLQECRSSTYGIPRNDLDLLTQAFGMTLPTTKARECLAQNLEEAGERICESQRKLDEHLRKYDNYDYRR